MGLSTNRETSEIQEFFKDKTIFLTGVSGFLGKAILEKLLRSCPGIQRVYVLIRPKNGTSTETRMKNILLSPIFDRLKIENPLCFQKVSQIEGNICLPNLGINPENRTKLSNEVSIVIHSAASVKFNEKLSNAMNINYYGTESIINLCYGMTKLKALVHISTAYSNCDKKLIKEEIYTPFISASEIKSMGKENADELASTIIGSKPNTYTFTKCLAENLLKNHKEQLPISIIRPSIICATAQEPIPGYVDSLNGLTGVAAGIGKGILRHMVGNEEKVADLIPLDMVVNLTLAAAWKTGSSDPHQKFQIYNCCSGSTNPITFENVRNNIIHSFSRIPVHGFPSKYPSFTFTPSRILNAIYNIILLLIPFLLIDLLSIISMKKPRMLKIYKKVTVPLVELRYFVENDFNFVTQNMMDLRSSMSKNDKEIFSWNIERVNWSNYFDDYCLGIKEWIFKEGKKDKNNNIKN